MDINWLGKTCKKLLEQLSNPICCLHELIEVHVRLPSGFPTRFGGTHLKEMVGWFRVWPGVCGSVRHIRLGLDKLGFWGAWLFVGGAA